MICAANVIVEVWEATSAFSLHHGSRWWLIVSQRRPVSICDTYVSCALFKHVI